MAVTLEEKVINSVCKNKDIHVLMREDAELFGAYSDIVNSMKSYYDKYRSVPSIDILLDRFDMLDKVDVTVSSSSYYMDELKDTFVKNRTMEILSKAASALDTDSAARVLEKLQTATAKLNKYSGGVRDVNMTDADAAVEHFQKLREAADANGTPGIATGFKSIDSAYPTGMAPGHSIVLLGYTGRAKSMWSADLAVNVWKQNRKVLIISLEMSPEEYRERAYALMGKGQFRISELSRGEVSIDDFQEWSRKNLDGKSEFIVVSNEGGGEVTPNTIQGKIDMYKPDLVILDYLQLMMDNAKTSAMTPRMLNLSREIKMLAVNNGIPIVSITAVTDEENDKRDRPPMLSQVAWSKGIEYDANLAIAVHRYDESPFGGGEFVAVVGRKNRHGPLFGFGFNVDFDLGIWEEVSDY